MQDLHHRNLLVSDSNGYVACYTLLTAVKPSYHLDEATVQMLYELGELVGYKPEPRWSQQGYGYDVVWHRCRREGPKRVLEVI